MEAKRQYRGKYIRFFISSTFADMERERNAIRRIIDRIQHEYSARHGWQVEYVDLRWGISREAGENNRTMSICLDELRLCQRLSPRPNFIVLLGERAGWFPLPEVMPAADMNRIMDRADSRALLCIKTSYRFNSNILPDGAWVLEPRQSMLFDASEVEPVLHALFSETFPADSPYRLSATQQEVVNGILSVPDSKDHVIAYLRTLDYRTVPTEERSRFCPDDNANGCPTEWHRRILDSSDPANVSVVTGLDWCRYVSDSYVVEFEQEIERKIRRIIDREISGYESRDEHENERLQHFDYAERLSGDFIGRESFINTVVDSVGTSDSPLLISGKPGVGKSSLMGRLACELTNRGYYVCMRFSSILTTGRTPDELSQSIALELDNVRDTPAVILVDAANELDLGNSLEKKRLGWLSALARRYQASLIVTVADGDTVECVIPGFISLELDPFEPAEAMTIIAGMLRGMGRRLTTAQTGALRRQFEHSGLRQGGLYMRLLASPLGQIGSEDGLPEIPDTIEGLVLTIANRLSSPEKHGQLLIRRALAILATIPEGIDYTNLSRILDSDQVLHDTLAKSSFHDWDKSERRLPPIYWSRLFHDLNGTIADIRSCSGGARIVIRHPEIRKALTGKWLTESDKVNALRLAFDFFNREWCNDNPVALHEVVSSSVRLILGDSNQDNRKSAASLGMSRLSDPFYIYMMQKADRRKLDMLYLQYYHALSRFSSHRETLEKFLRSQADVRRWPDLLSIEHAMALAANMPDDTNVRAYAMRRPESARVLADELRNITTDGYIIQSLPDTDGMRFTRLTADGDALYYIYPEKNHCIICRMEVKTGLLQKVSGNLLPDIIDFAISRDGSVRAVLLPEGRSRSKLYVVNGTQAWSTVYSDRYSVLDVSPDGAWIALTHSGKPIAFISSDGNRHNSLNDPDAKKCEAMRFSDDSQWIWTLRDGNISRYSRSILESGKGTKNSFGQDKEHMTALWGRKRIISTYRSLIAVYNEKVCDVLILNFEDSTIRHHLLYYPGCTFVNVANAADGLDKIKAVYGSERGHIGEITGNGDNSLRIRQTASVFPVNAVSDDLSVALSMECGCLFDLRRMMHESLYLASLDNVGLNNMTSSLKSDKMLVSIGKNRAQEFGTIQFPILTERLADGSWHERQLRVEGLDITRYTLSSAISPDGTLAAFFQDEPSNSIILYDLKSDTGKTIFKITLGVVAMTFTADSRFLIAVTGDYIASNSTVISVFDRDGRHLYTDALEGHDLMDVMGATHIRVTEDNRWLIFGSWSVSVYDLVTRRLVKANCADVETWASISHKDRTNGILVDQTPLMFWDYGRKALLTSRSGEHYEVEIPSCKVTVTKDSLTLIGLDVDTRLLLDRKSGTLYIRTYSIDAPRRVADNVVMAFPCFDGKHFYAYHMDRRISLNTYEGKELQYAYPLNYVPMRFQVTADGLAIGRSDGHVAFFRPDARFGVNNRMDIPGLYRWNLTTGEFCEPCAICPRCGTRIAGVSTYGDIACPGCGTPLNVMTDPERPG